MKFKETGNVSTGTTIRNQILNVGDSSDPVMNQIKSNAQPISSKLLVFATGRWLAMCFARVQLLRNSK
jgi:hypothetical protein